MRGTRGGLLALAVGLAALALLVRSGGAVATPDSLLLDPVGTFSAPTYMTSPPGDTDRLVVVQQTGVISLVLDGVVQGTPFLTVPNVLDDGNERGLFSIAFAPDYATSGLFYVYYTSTAGPGNLQVDEFKRDVNNPNIADPSTRRSVITIPHPGQSNHNGGQLQFGPDDLLYMGTGDGGGGGDPFRAAMNLQDLRGKLLRIDPRQVGQEPYTVPANNPFVGVPGALPEIWSYGLRNPWRFSFDRVTNDLTLGDVGQNRTRRSTSDPSTPAGGARSTSAGAASRDCTSTARATRTAIHPIPTSSRRSSSTPMRAGMRARSPGATSSGTRKSRASSAGTSTATTATGRSTRTSFRSQTCRATLRPGSMRATRPPSGRTRAVTSTWPGSRGARTSGASARPTRRASSASRGTTCPF